MSGKDINTMLRMYERGKTAKAIGQELGRSPSVISSTLLRMKKQLTSRELPPETREVIKEAEKDFIAAWKAWKKDNSRENLFAFMSPFYRPNSTKR